MVRYDVVGGLKRAVEKGKTLKQVMIEFYNAGYEKNDIEEAARFLNSGQQLYPMIQEQEAVEGKRKKKSKKQESQPAQVQQTPQTQSQQIQQQVSQAQPAQIVSGYGQQPVQKKASEQKVSIYGQKPKKSGKLFIIVLISALVVLVGLLILLFVFKDNVLDFLNSLL